MDKLIDYLLMRQITAGDVVLNTILVLFGLAILVSFWRMHRGNGRYENFNLVYLIVSKDGYPDGAKCIELGTWLLLAWGFVVYVTSKTLPEWYVQIFVVAFVIRGGYGAYLRAKGGPEAQPGTTIETTIKSTEVSKAPTGEQKASPFAEPSKGS